MSFKNKTAFLSSPPQAIFPAAIVLAAILLAAAAAGEIRAEEDYFSGRTRLKSAVWRLSGFPTPPEGGRTLTAAPAGRSPLTVEFTFGEELDPWPESLRLTRPGETLTDRRPFGGPNLRLNGAALAGSVPDAENSIEILTGQLEEMSEALLKRPRLGELVWREAGPGLETAQVKILYGARFGPPELIMARFDPATYLFKPYQESEFPEPAEAAGWAARLTEAAALLNGGQYYPDRRPMGRLRRDGLDLSPTDHARWQGFLVSGPRPESPPDSPRAALIDLTDKRPGLEPDQYLNVLQSFMLLDRRGRIRVRDTSNLASRSAVAEDRSGRIIWIMTPAAISLYDLALILQDPRLELVQAMGLDGGFEAQTLLRGEEGTVATYGQYSISPRARLHLPGYRRDLPIILAAEPAEKSAR